MGCVRCSVVQCVLEVVSSRRHMTEAACDLQLESQDWVKR